MATSDDDRFGTDVSTFVMNDEGAPDLDPNFAIITGPRVVAEGILRRWLTKRGTLITDPSIGVNLRAYLSAEMDASTVDALRSELVLEALRDARVSAITVDVSLDAKAEKLTITAAVKLSDDSSFDMVATIDNVDASLVLRNLNEAAA